MAQASGRSGCAAPSTEQASRGVIPWVADTSYFHWAPGSEARRLDAPSCDGGADSSASGASGANASGGRFRPSRPFLACTVAGLIGATLLAATICLAASSNWMLLSSAVSDAGANTSRERRGPPRLGLLLRRQSGNRSKSVSEETRSLQVSLATESVEGSQPLADSTMARGNWTESIAVTEPPTSPTPAGACGVAFYTYCPILRDEYRASTRDRMCVPSGADRVAVCNRGRNRFASLEECHRACALLQGPTRETCYEQPLFTACHRQDVVGAWWYFDGFRCAEWDFPHGECPLNSTGGGVDVYSSLDECRAQCDAGGRRRCRPPASATCDSGQLRFPYFARLLPNGRGLCASASLGTLFAHRCLVGANRFDSLATCRDTCLRQ
ncbi:uncharacterized protein LOC144102322 [Amblyomma americanum]